jgi:PAS domain S-box-containing protein
VNTENEKITVYGREEMIGKPLRELIHPDDLVMMKRYHAARLKVSSSAPRNYEFRLVRKDGKVRDIYITADIIPGTKSVISSLVDITERKKMENALRDSECMYRTLFEATGTVMMIMEEDMTISLANDEFYRLSGCHPTDKRKAYELVHEDDRERMIEWHRNRRKNSLSAPRSYEFKYVKVNGEVRDGLIHVAMIPGTTKSIASIVDISQIKHAEEELKRSKGELEIKSQGLEEANAALRVLLKHREEDRHVLEERVLANVKELVMPYLEKLRATRLSIVQRSHAEVIESKLNDILSPFLHGLTSKYSNLTPKEIQIINFIREGRTTKEIAALMNASSRTIDFHRNNIRKKFGIKNRRTNLRTFLIALQ